MTPVDLRTFIREIRAEATARLAWLETIDPADLSSDLRQKYRRSVRGWKELLALTDDDAVALHEAACRYAGRELTTEELRGLLNTQ